MQEFSGERVSQRPLLIYRGFMAARSMQKITSA